MCHEGLSVAQDEALPPDHFPTWGRQYGQVLGHFLGKKKERGPGLSDKFKDFNKTVVFSSADTVSVF